MTVERPNQFKIRLSDDEVRWIEVLAHDAGVTKTDYVRLLVRREWEGRQAKKRKK